MYLPTHETYGDNYEWCGILEYPDRNDLFLNNVYRISVCKNGKWGYACVLADSRGKNKLKIMFEPRFEEFLSNSKYGYVIAKEGKNLCVVNLIGAQYAKGDKKGQYVYGEVGEVLFKYECDEMYPINITSIEWSDYGSYARPESKRTFQFVILRVNGKYGIVNRNGIIIQKFVFDDMYSQYQDKPRDKVFADIPFIVERDNKKGLIGIDGKTILDTQYEEIYRIGRYWCLKELGNKKYMLYNSFDNIFFDYEFDKIIYGNYDFFNFKESGYDDYFIINNSKYGICSGDGVLFVDCKYDDIQHIHENYEVKLNNKIGILSKNGKQLVPCEYDEIKENGDASGACDGYYVYQNQKVGFYTYDGKLIIDCDNDSINNTSGIESYHFELVRNKKSALFSSDKLVTEFIFDSIGKIIHSRYEIEEYVYLLFHDVTINGKHGMINENGECILKCEYDSISLLSHCLPNKSPLFVIEIKGKKGVVATNGEVIIPAEYDSIKETAYYSNRIDSYIVEKDGKKAIIDNDWYKIGDLITDFDYTDIRVHYSEDHNVLGYYVRNSKGCGFIDEFGEELLPIKYDNIEAVEDPDDPNSVLLYIITKNLKKGAVDTSGNIIVPCNYDNCDLIKTKNNKYLCYNDNHFDENGNIIYEDGEPYTALNIVSRETYALEARWRYYAYTELVREGL